MPCVVGGRGRLVCFLRDQQDCVVWYLYLTPEGGEFVIGSCEGRIDAAEWEWLNDGVPPSAEELAEAIEDAAVCAPTFETFLYRFCLEVRIYRKVTGYDKAPLTDAERAYLAHYEARTDLPQA